MINNPISRAAGDPVALPGSTAKAAASTTNAPLGKAAAQVVTPTVEVDPKTNEPVAIRFPWLSRLTAALAAVAIHPWPFKSVEVTGENVDGSA